MLELKDKILVELWDLTFALRIRREQGSER
jgi:hypothetical protein